MILRFGSPVHHRMHVSSMSWIQIVTAIIASLTLVGVAIGRLPALKMNRATIALVGATLLVVIGALGLEDAFRAVDWNTILLLFGMMVLNVNLRAAGFFQIVTSRVLRLARTPRRLLALLLAVSGGLSALFLNDTIVLVFTPLVLEMAAALRRNPLPYLVGLVTAANIGSVATITGNPQNMLVGMASGIGFVEFTVALAPIAFAGLAVAWGVLVIVYRREFRAEVFDNKHAPDIAAGGEGERRELVQPRRLRKSLLASAVLIVALVSGMPVPLAAALSAALLLISRRTEPETVFQEIDWSLLVFFCGLFVVTGAIEHSGLGMRLFAVLQPLAGHGTGALAAVAVVLSNIVSNVPAVMLFRPIVPALPDPHGAWLTLAATTTLAGNLTLLGSVANLIVAEIARRHGTRLGFVEYLKAGLPIAVLTLLLAVAWLSR